MGFGCFGPSRVKECQHLHLGPPPVAVRSAALPEDCRYFSYRELEEATKGWARGAIIGDGGFGRVYKGRLRSGEMIAAKRLDRHGMQGDKEFNVEVAMLARLRHRSVVKLLGICVEGDQRVAVFELLQGSLASALRGGAQEPDQDGARRASHAAASTSSGPAQQRARLPGGGKEQEGTPLIGLSWEQRLQIAVDVAQGLAYLHQERLIHRDVTSGNVLLAGGGNAARARIADFGLAQQLPCAEAVVRGAPPGLQPDAVLMGTYGYCAPEYAATGELSQKTDVFAYGVVLLELLTGKPAVDGARPPGCQLLAEWLLPSLACLDHVWEHLDARMDRASMADAQLAAIADVALACLAPKPSDRARMKDVVRCVEAVAAFKPAMSCTPPETVASAAANGSRNSPQPQQAPHLLDALHPLPPSSAGFEDPFGCNPFRAAVTLVPPSPSQHSPLLQGASRFASAEPLLLEQAAPPRTQLASASSATSQPVQSVWPDADTQSSGEHNVAAAMPGGGGRSEREREYGSSSSSSAPSRVLGSLASARPRAEGALPRAQPEDWASPLASGMRFPALSRESPDFGGPPPERPSGQGTGAVSTESLSPLFQAIASRQGSPEARSAGQASPERAMQRGLAGAASGRSGSSANGDHRQQSLAARMAQKEWQQGGPPSAPALTPRIEGSICQLQAGRQGHQGNNALADSAASMVLASTQLRAGRAASIQEHAGLLAATAAAVQGSSSVAPSPAVSVGQGSSGGNPFRGSAEGAPLFAQQSSPGNPFADLPAEPPGQAANSPYSVPSEGSSSGMMHRRSSDSVHWRTNLAASWETDGLGGSAAAAAGKGLPEAMRGSLSSGSKSSHTAASLSPLEAVHLLQQQHGEPWSPASRPDLQLWMQSPSLKAATS